MTPAEWLAGAQLVRALILVSVDGGEAMERDLRARNDEQIVLHAALEVRSSRGCAWITTASTIAGTRCTLVQAPADTLVEWSKVEADEAAYDNVPGGVFSLASIGWVESRWTTGWSVPADVRPVVRRGVFVKAGTMRYRVTVSLGHERWSSPGLNEERGGPAATRDIRKVSLRSGDDYLGVMTELANIPYIFGSTEVGREIHQAERAIGVDCADLVIYGLKRTGHDLQYRSSRTLGPISRRVSEARAGDWIIFSGHVGVLYEDRGVLGKVDGPDLMMHIAWQELAIEPLSASAYGTTPFEVRRYDDTLTSRQKPIQ